MKIVTIVGARPHFIKAAVVSREFNNYDNINEIIIHTGQHFDNNMSDVFFKEMHIPEPTYQLNINGLDHGAMTGRMLESIEKIIIKEKPDWVLVYGDTNSTLAGTLAAKKLNIKLAHVESGLRSNDLRVPEEINRILTDRISDLLFCPSESALINLRNEGFDMFNCNYIVSGDVMQDAAIYYSNLSKTPNFDLPEKFVLSTIHRAENTNDLECLHSIFNALEQISESHTVVLPIHPRTKAVLESVDYNFQDSKICFIPPIGYLEMVYLLKNCEFVVCDSGGLQKEAYFFNKLCVFIHETDTVWKELVENGFLYQARPNYNSIMNAIEKIGNTNPDKKFNKRLYGNGDAGGKVVKAILSFNNYIN